MNSFQGAECSGRALVWVDEQGRGAAERLLDARRRSPRRSPKTGDAPSTTPAERQAIVRELVDRVVVTVVGDTEKVVLQVHWHGGHVTETAMVRPVRRLSQLSYLLLPHSDHPRSG